MPTQSSDHHPDTATVSHNNHHDYKKYYPLPEAEYEEIAQNPDVFLGNLKCFHESFGTKFKVPIIGGRALDLYRLFLEVTSRGGIEKVIRDRKWKEVISAFNFPATITSASFVLRKYYLSLLYHFEQVYYFRKEVPSFSLDDPESRTGYNGSATPYIHEDGAGANELPDQVSFTLECGNSITGTIDAKFDTGYLITVELGDEKLKGVLYHTQISNALVVPRHRRRKRYQPAVGRDPSGANFLFAEQYTTSQSRPSYHGQEKAIVSEMLDFRSPNNSTVPQ